MGCPADLPKNRTITALVNDGLFVVFLTPMFMLLSDFIHPAEGLIVARLTNEFVGACVGVAVSFLLWPQKESSRATTVS